MAECKSKKISRRTRDCRSCRGKKHTWKRQLLEAAPAAFTRGKDRLSGMSVTEKTACVDKDPKLCISRQCELLRLPRFSYYRPRFSCFESAENLEIMRRIDEEFLRHPFYGSRKIRNYLNREGFHVNRKRVQRLMRLMGLESVAPKPNTS